jgi:hypothetical protein
MGLHLSPVIYGQKPEYYRCYAQDTTDCTLPASALQASANELQASADELQASADELQASADELQGLRSCLLPAGLMNVYKLIG